MAKDLSAASGIGSDADYLNGNIVDGQTDIGAYINQDIVQFFQKLMALASVTPNGNHDNEANTYQFVSAMETFISLSTLANFPWLTVARTLIGFQDAGDPIAQTFAKTDLTGGYLDLSTIVPEYTKMVLLRVVTLTSGSAIGDGGYIGFHKYGNSYYLNESGHWNKTQTAVAKYSSSDMWVPVNSSNRYIAYNLLESGSGFTSIKITVAGWSM